MPKITNDWISVIGGEFEKPYYQMLRSKLKTAYQTETIFPVADDIFNAFHYTPYHKVKVLIVGQDPYHNINQAHGLCFSVKPGEAIPPSLQNIYKELHTDLGCSIPNHGYLREWADQGVLLLNTVLTVRAHQANSHQGMGWEQFTDSVIHAVNQINRPVVIFLWGKPAQRKRSMLNNPQHLVIESPHPSPLSAFRGFFGSRPFSRANQFLEVNGVQPINWQIQSIG